MKYTVAPAMELSVSMPEPWIGFDLDGTVAQYDGFKGWDVIGDPVPGAVEFIKNLRARGITCKILTARASAPSRALNNLTFAQVEQVIQDWTEKHLGERLPVVTEKDCAMLFFVDDSAIQVRANKFEMIGGKEALLQFADRIKEAAKPKEEEQE